jgi:hypothetical protein
MIGQQGQSIYASPTQTKGDTGVLGKTHAPMIGWSWLSYVCL